MSEVARDKPVPRAALAGAAALIAFAFTASWLSVETGIGATRLPEAAIVEARDLQFKDGDDGSVRIVDAMSGTLVGVIESGAGGFERGVLRSLARERRAHSIGSDTPFRLVQRADGTLSIQDPATGRRIDLDAFGATNLHSFARLVRTPTRSGESRDNGRKGEGA